MDPYQGGIVDSFASFFYSSFNSTSDSQEDELAHFVTTDPPSPASSIQVFYNEMNPHQGGVHVDSFTSFF
jgi:hypothetical protein